MKKSIVNFGHGLREIAVDSEDNYIYIEVFDEDAITDLFEFCNSLLHTNKIRAYTAGQPNVGIFRYTILVHTTILGMLDGINIMKFLHGIDLPTI